jgi:hypothetical protein
VRKKRKKGGDDDKDWEVHTDEEGDTYYHNKKTGATSWEDPRKRASARMNHNPMKGAKGAQTEGIELPNAPPPHSEWEKHEDEEGTPYWHNESTGVTSWDDPVRPINQFIIIF